MLLTFLGTRGGITKRSPEHSYHSSLLVTYQNYSIVLDWGQDWLTRKIPLTPDALLITHAHPDHAAGLRNGAPCPVYATQDSWDSIKSYPITERNVIIPYTRYQLGPFAVTAYPVVHSLRAPAVGYSISTKTNRTIKKFFYAPDLVSIPDQTQALKNSDLYIGDGAIITRTLLIKKRHGQRIGHAPISQQAAWCAQEKVPLFIITHCGTEIVTSDPVTINQKLAALAYKYQLQIILATDMMEYRL